MKTTELQKASKQLIFAAKNLEKAETALSADLSDQLSRTIGYLASFIRDADKERSNHEAETARQLRELSGSISGLVVERCKAYMAE
tara:strand:- start:6340 stop:6597 length:258 start_codon:yes stop_codon:yes gene_type:complete